MMIQITNYMLLECGLIDFCLRMIFGGLNKRIIG